MKRLLRIVSSLSLFFAYDAYGQTNVPAFKHIVIIFQENARRTISSVAELPQAFAVHRTTSSWVLTSRTAAITNGPLRDRPAWRKIPD